MPAIPLVVPRDGLVSCRRTYTPDELRGRVAGLGGDGYAWEAGELRARGPTPVTYPIGRPRVSAP